jgi:threonylcarbamoyladenosine tRNA methylthiotransferase MtaB
MTRKVAFRTLGCRLNQYETDALASQFQDAGYDIAEFGEAADVYVVNTCTVTAESDRKSRNIIGQALNRKKEPVVVVTGCMATHYRDDLEQAEPITYVVDNERKSSIFSLVDSHFRGEVTHPHHLRRDLFGYEIADKTFHTRSLIKIQDGCDNHCTFCIVPHVRGRAVSRPVKDILKNIRGVIDKGYKEVVLTGVNIGRYAHEGTTFEDLVASILRISGDFRVRISSIEPDGFGEEFFDLLSHPKMTPHLHLCLQSGSDRILRRMRRMYSVKGYLRMIENIRHRIQDFNFTTDIIVGFPGESDSEFQQTLNVAGDVGFTHIHTFKYSVRQGTRAARMEGKLCEAVKKERSATIRDLSVSNKQKYYTAMTGKAQRLLVERIEDGQARGYGEHYIPISMDAGGLSINEFCEVRLEDIANTNGLNMTAALGKS